MSEISDLESRLTAAMERIGRGAEAIATRGADQAEVDQLRQALEDEKLTSAQLEERVRSLHQKLEYTETSLAAAKAAAEAAEDTVAPATDAALEENRVLLGDLGRRLRRLRRSVREVRGSNQQLREAAEAGISDPVLINQALATEVETLKAEREVERAEVAALIGVLQPLLGTQATASDADTQMEDS